jgi:hypothetical protein
MLKYMANYEGGSPPFEATAHFVSNMQMVRLDADEPAAIEVPYWKMAHYAAREQAEEDAKYPPLTVDQLLSIAANRIGPVDKGVQEWLERKIEEGFKHERVRR